MAEADCPVCEASGFRSCDECGNPIFPPFDFRGGPELCAYCEDEAADRTA